mmetsp:Transcript_36077/g.56325  ORF Transcript_36077/g.56325 Transcript_36077/m.56325 type:complete len:98 (-) Transcript_36077:2058-2351(-)
MDQWFQQIVGNNKEEEKTEAAETDGQLVQAENAWSTPQEQSEYERMQEQLSAVRETTSVFEGEMSGLKDLMTGGCKKWKKDKKKQTKAMLLKDVASV